MWYNKRSSVLATHAESLEVLRALPTYRLSLLRCSDNVVLVLMLYELLYVSKIYYVLRLRSDLQPVSDNPSENIIDKFRFQRGTILKNCFL